MENHSLLVFQYLAAAAVGCAIGLAFGLVQDLAAKRYLRRQREGAAQTPWSVLPGSGRRVAALLVILAFVQVFCPMLFSNGVEWFVSGGVALGYGINLYLRLRQRLRGES